MVGLLLAACLGGPAAEGTPEPLRPTSTRVAGPEPTATPALDANPATLLARAVCWYEDPARAASCVPPPQDALDAIAAMGASRDRRFVAPLVDMRAVDVGWGREIDAALESLTGERHDSEADWYRWLGAHPGALPPGYLEWKGRLLGISDATFTRVLGGASGDGVRPELVAWTGLRVGELPRLVAPRTANPANHGYLENDDVVYGLQLGGALRAYPQRLLSWHPIVHDRLGGGSVLVTYCGPCRSAAAFTPSIGGRELQFQDAGLWLDGRPLMVDEQTGSVWDAISGRAIIGTMATARAQLPRVGLVTLRWEEWATEHPSTAVLALDTGFVRDYSGASQRARDASLAARFPSSAPADGRLPRETRVIGVAAGNEVRAYVLSEVQARRTVLDTVGGERVLLLAQGPVRPVRVYRPGALDLRAYHDDESAEGSDGREGERWWVRESGIVSQLDGRTHEAGAWTETSWEAWSGAHPGVSLWGH
ncbi:MAG: DUF3179 domain-containing protein [Dehalococcoidia bacterium]|nr:DUF3179 domain-containing protein [Dehalococcoidia bacterium]